MLNRIILLGITLILLPISPIFGQQSKFEGTNRRSKKADQDFKFKFYMDIIGSIGRDSRNARIDASTPSDITPWATDPVKSLGSGLGINFNFQFLDKVYLKVGYNERVYSGLSTDQWVLISTSDAIPGLVSIGYLDVAGGLALKGLYLGVGAFIPIIKTLHYNVDNTPEGKNIAKTYWNQGVYFEGGFRMNVYKRLSLKFGLHAISWIHHAHSSVIGDVPSEQANFEDPTGMDLGVDFGVAIRLM